MESAPRLKDVAFGDGLLRFRIPAGWIEGQESDGSGAFYDESLDGGTLRLKVMTFTSEEDLTGHVALEELEAMQPEPGQKLELLPNGNALRSHREESEANGERTVFHIWLLASIDAPHQMRLAVFSFTSLATEANALATRRLVLTLDREIRQALFVHQISQSDRGRTDSPS